MSVMTATAGQRSCASSFFIRILSTEEPKNFRLTGTISVWQVRSGAIYLNLSGSKSLADDPKEFHRLLFARTFVATDALESPPERCVFFNGLVDPAFSLTDDSPSAGIFVEVEPVTASTFIPVHHERVGVRGVGRERECVVGVLHAPIITEPQAVSSLGSDIFQIVFEISKEFAPS